MATTSEQQSDRARFIWAAAFYLLALAAQMSGYTNSVIAIALAGIATLLLVVPLGHQCRTWHSARREAGMWGLDSWYVIVPCLVVATIAIAGASYGLGLRGGAAKSPPGEFASIHSSTSTQRPEYLKNIGFLYDPQLPLGISATIASTVDRLRVVVEYQADIPISGHFSGPGNARPIQIAEFKDLVRGANINFQLIFGADKPAGLPEYFWGEPKHNFPVGGLNRVRLVVIGPEKTEQHVYFFVIRGMASQLITIIREQDHDWIREWRAKEG